VNHPLRRAVGSLKLPLALAPLALALALLAQGFFSRGPNLIREALLCAVLAIGCFMIADWLRELQPPAADTAETCPTRAAPRPPPVRLGRQEENDACLQP
jgi:hypothetical protein